MQTVIVETLKIVFSTKMSVVPLSEQNWRPLIGLSLSSFLSFEQNANRIWEDLGSLILSLG